MMFDRLKAMYGKVYSGMNMFLTRFEQFKANDGIIRATNVRNMRFTLGVKECTDLDLKRSSAITHHVQQRAR